MEWRKYDENMSLEEWKNVIVNEGGLQTIYDTFKFVDNEPKTISAPLLTCAAFHDNVELMKYIVELELVNCETGMTTWQEYDTRTHITKASSISASKNYDDPQFMWILSYDGPRDKYFYHKGPLDAAEMGKCENAIRYLREEVLCPKSTIK